MKKVFHILFALIVLVGSYDLYAIEQFSRVKVWGREVLTKDDLNAEFDAIINGLNTKLLNGGTTFTIIAGDSILVEGRGVMDTLRVRTVFLLEGDIEPDLDGAYNIGTSGARIDTFWVQDINAYKTIVDTIAARGDSVKFVSEAYFPKVTVDNLVIDGDSVKISGGRQYFDGYDAIVDSAGVLSTYTQIQPAISAGAKTIFITKGTYSPFDANVTGLYVEGESVFNVIIDGATTDDAVDVSGNYVTLKNLQLKTTAGSGNGYSGVNLSASYFRMENCWVPQSDDKAINGNNGSDLFDCVILDNTFENTDDVAMEIRAERWRIEGNLFLSVGAYAFDGVANGDNSIFVGNTVKDPTTAPFFLRLGNDNWTVVGNRLDGAGTNSSGNSTVTGNDETAF